MDDKQLEELRAKVDHAELLKKQISKLDDVISSCNAEVGFVSITVNFKNQNEIRLVEHFQAKELFDAFGGVIKEAAISLKTKLETEYKNLK